MFYDSESRLYGSCRDSTAWSGDGKRARKTVAFGRASWSFGIPMGQSGKSMDHHDVSPAAACERLTRGPGAPQSPQKPSQVRSTGFPAKTKVFHLAVKILTPTLCDSQPPYRYNSPPSPLCLRASVARTCVGKNGGDKEKLGLVWS